MSDCCNTPQPSVAALTKNALCIECGEPGRSVPRLTVLHHVKSEKLCRVCDEEYKFCATPACSVVYFAASGELFTVSDVRELVTIKASGGVRPLCYCFGFMEGDIREEIERTGQSSVPAQIGRLIKEKMCACEIRNPSGACCLGEINRVVKRFSVAEEVGV
jgi:hypothetical protein